MEYVIMDWRGVFLTLAEFYFGIGAVLFCVAVIHEIDSGRLKKSKNPYRLLIAGGLFLLMMWPHCLYRYFCSDDAGHYR